MLDKWKNELVEGYKNDHVFRKILLQLEEICLKNKRKGAMAMIISTDTSHNPLKPIKTTPIKQSIDIGPNPSESIRMIPPKDSLPTDDILNMGSLEQFIDQHKDEKKMVIDEIFSLINEVLYFSEMKNSHLHLCIPRSMMNEVLRHNHDLLSHPSIHRTYLALHLRYYIPKMLRVVKCYVNKCAVCQTSKPSHESSLRPLYPIPVEESCHTLSLDFITSLPVSQRKDTLFTITDKFMKAMHLIPCNKDTDIIETARLYLKYYYSVFSLSFKFISD